MAKIGKGYLMATIQAFDNVENKHIVDCIAEKIV